MIEEPVEVALDFLRAAVRDAQRYRFLRDEDNWGEDSGTTSWEALGQSTLLAFDQIVDTRMNRTEADSQSLGNFKAEEQKS